MMDALEYQRLYYKTNRKEIIKKKQKKYHNDPAYRQYICSKSNYYRRLKMFSERTLDTLKKVSKYASVDPWRLTVIMADECGIDLTWKTLNVALNGTLPPFSKAGFSRVVDYLKRREYEKYRKVYEASRAKDSSQRPKRGAQRKAN